MAFELPSMPNFSAAVPPASSPIDQYGRVLQLKALLGQQQLLPLQVQAEQERVKGLQTQNEMQQITLAGQKALTNYWSNPDKFQSDKDEFQHNDALAGMLGIAPDDPLMGTVRGQIKAGVPAPIAFAEAKSTLQMRQEASKATQEQQAVLKNSFEQLREIAAPILAEKDATKKQALLDGAMPGLARWAKFDPQLAQVIPQLHAGNFDAFANRIGAEEKALGISKTSADTAKAEAEAQKAQQEQAYRGTLKKLLNGEKVSPDELASARAYEAGESKTTTQADTLGVTSTNTSKPAGLAVAGARGAKTVAPVATSSGGAGGAAAAGAGATPEKHLDTSPASLKGSIVDEIGQFKMNPAMMSRMLVKHPELIGMVAQKYPEWSQPDYNAKNAIVSKYTSGGESKSINAISTALGHAGELGEAIDALNSSNGLNALRKLGQKLGVSILGDDKVTIYNTVLHRLAPEITQAYVQGGGGEKERFANEDDFAASLGDAQKRGNLKETIKLLRSKIEAQEQQWNTTYKPTRPEDDFTTRFLTPRAKKTLEDWAPQEGTGGTTKNGNGITITLPSKKTIHID